MKDKIKKLNDDAFFQELYDEKSIEKIINGVRDEAYDEGRIETVIEFLRNCAPIELVSKSTGISIDELKRIENEEK